MVQAQINIAIISHISRYDMAKQLYSEVCESDKEWQLIDDIRIFTDAGHSGALLNHKRALMWAEITGVPTVIIEDDAMPVRDLSVRLVSAINRHAGLPVSFYLGTGRPPQYQEGIAEAVRSGVDFIRLPTLIHGVCYHVPHRHLIGLTDRIDDTLPADFAIGAAVNNDFVYPVASLVDHFDGEPVECHKDGEPRSEPRKAWKLADETIRKAETQQAEGLLS